MIILPVFYKEKDMVITDRIAIGSTAAGAVMVKSPGGEGHPNMILIECNKGYLMCGYLNLEAAEKFGDAAVLVGGADFNEVLANPIKGMTTAARKLGITDGMTGREAAMILNL